MSRKQLKNINQPQQHNQQRLSSRATTTATATIQGGTHLVGQRPYRGAERSRQAEIRDLEGTVAAHQKVLRLEVPAHPATKNKHTNTAEQRRPTNQLELLYNRIQYEVPGT